MTLPNGPKANGREFAAANPRPFQREAVKLMTAGSFTRTADTLGFGFIGHGNFVVPAITEE